MRNIVINKKLEYIRKLFAQEDDILQNITQDIKDHDHQINIGAEEGKFLQVLIKSSNVKNILEIGTHFAYSTIWMARALPDDGSIITIEKDLVRAEHARQNLLKAGLDNKVQLVAGSADEILAKTDKIFDLIFIDANKSAYPKYLKWAIDHVRKNGLIIADNCLLSEEVYLEQSKFSKNQINAMQEFNNIIANHPNLTSIIIPTEEGISVSVKTI
jgi:predicted O-methyltransferase YrrM